MTTVRTFAVQDGDRKVYLDTSKPEERDKLANTIAQKLRQGAALFVHWMDGDYRVKSYDRDCDELILHAKRVRGNEPRTFRVSAANIELYVVAPQAGG